MLFYDFNSKKLVNKKIIMIMIAKEKEYYIYIYIYMIHTRRTFIFCFELNIVRHDVYVRDVCVYVCYVCLCLCMRDT